MVRIWHDDDNDTTLVWDIAASVRRVYSQDTRVVRDCYDLPHEILTRANPRNVVEVELRFPRGLLAQENAATPGPQTLKSYLQEAYLNRHYLTLFDTDGAQFYAGRLSEPDETITSNESEYDGPALIAFKVTVTADGTYSDFDVLTSITAGSRP